MTSVSLQGWQQVQDGIFQDTIYMFSLAAYLHEILPSLISLTSWLRLHWPANSRLSSWMPRLQHSFWSAALRVWLFILKSWLWVGRRGPRLGSNRLECHLYNFLLQRWNLPFSLPVRQKTPLVYLLMQLLLNFRCPESKVCYTELFLPSIRRGLFLC